MDLSNPTQPSPVARISRNTTCLLATCTVHVCLQKVLVEDLEWASDGPLPMQVLSASPMGLTCSSPHRALPALTSAQMLEDKRGGGHGRGPCSLWHAVAGV